MSSVKRKIVLKGLKALNTIWHPESTLVFKSKKERKVIGRYVDGEMIPLDDESLQLCVKWRFKYDESLVEEEEGDEGDEGDEEEESVPEEEESVPEEEESVPEEESEKKVDPIKAVVPENEAVETENVVKKVSKVSTNPVVTGSFDITKLTSEFTGKLVIAVKSLQQELSNVTSSLSDKSDELVSESDKLTSVTTELAEMTVKYEAMKSKFEGIKKLFA